MHTEKQSAPQSTVKRYLYQIPLNLGLIAVSTWLTLLIQKKEAVIGAGVSRLLLFLVINVQILVAVYLLTSIVRQAFKLFIERKKGQPGSVFKQNLLFAFTLFSIIPALFVIISAGKFITGSIDQWFKSNVDRGLASGTALFATLTGQSRTRLAHAGLQLQQGLQNGKTFNELQHLPAFKAFSVKQWLPIPGSGRINLGDEINVWRSYRLVNDRSTKSLRKELLAQLRPLKTGEYKLLDFYGSTYFVLRTTNGFIALIQRYEKPIRDHLITLHTASSNYKQMRSVRGLILTNYIIHFILITLIIIFLAIWTAFYLARGISAPIEKLIAAMGKLKEGRFDTALEENRHDDLQALTVGFNEMVSALKSARCDLEVKNQELLLLSRLKTWQEAAKQIAHEIKNPLTPIQLATQRLQRKCLPALPHEQQELLKSCTDMILQQVDIIKNLAAHFYTFASLPALQLQPICLVDLLRETFRVYQLSFPFIAITLEDHGLGGLIITSDKAQLARIFVNLFDNSIRALQQQTATNQAPAIHVTVRQLDDGMLSILISDNGPGIAPAVQESLFLPYVSSEKKNMGLGLAIAGDICKQLGGSLRLVPSTTGATFELTLPT